MHLAFSPIGVLIATVLLSRYAGVWGWSDRDSLGFLAELVPLGVVAYAAAVFVTEQVIRMVFWALAQREKDIEKRRAEGWEKGRAAGHAEGHAEGRAEGRREGRQEAEDSILQTLAEFGIELPTNDISAIMPGRAAVLLESGDVYGGAKLDVYLGRINPPGQELMARQAGPPELPDLWCQRGWRIQLNRHFEDLLPAGRIQGLTLDTSAPLWTVSLA